MLALTKCSEHIKECSFAVHSPWFTALIIARRFLLSFGKQKKLMSFDWQKQKTDCCTYIHNKSSPYSQPLYPILTTRFIHSEVFVCMRAVQVRSYVKKNYSQTTPSYDAQSDYSSSQNTAIHYYYYYSI